jgi:proteasome lid subunit RPN8/RPN11
MPRRVEIQDSIPPVRVPGQVLHELFAHARDTHPEECCGLIIGDADVRFRSVVRCRNEATPRHLKHPESQPKDGREAFVMNEQDYARAEAAAESRGERVTAVYHSHVGAGAYLSETDLAYAENALFPFPDADLVVIAVDIDGDARQVKAVGLFRRDPAGGGFSGRRVVAAAEEGA